MLLHGDEDACWPLVAHAGALGLPSRIGLEDTLTGPYGEAVTGNAELVRLGLAAWRSAAPRPPGPLKEHRAKPGCPPRGFRVASKGPLDERRMAARERSAGTGSPRVRQNLS